MNRPGQPPQRPPNLGPSQAIGGPFRAPFPPSNAFGLPSRTGLQQQGFPGMPNAHRTPGQSLVLPSPGFLQQQQAQQRSGVANAYPFSGSSLQQQQQATAQQQLAPSHQPTQASLAANQSSTQNQQANQQLNASGPNGSAQQAGGSLQESQLDPNDFPALGSTSVNPSTNSPATTFAQSYATQAGTGLPPGNAAAQSAGSGASQTRDFTPDDFPALGGGGSSQSQQHHQPPQTQPQTQSSTNGSSVLQGQGQESNQSHPPGLNGFETRQTMPPGLLNLTGAQRNMVAADAEKRATSKLSTWSGVGAAGASAGNGATSSSNTQPTQQQQQNGTLQSLPSVPPGVPSPFPQQSGAGESLQQNTTTAIPQTPAQQILISAADRWGLLGLLTSIKNADPDQNLLTIGTDLGTMGLDMQTQGTLFSTFITPWSDSSAAHTVEPDFHLPQCYNVNAPAPGPSKAQAFSEETLFYMFYAHPRDALQEVAAQELFARNWRFNKELRLWLTKETGRMRHSKTIENGAGEQGIFTYWDPDMWEKGIKEFTVMYADLENKDAPPAFVGATLQPTQQQQQQQGVQSAGAGTVAGAGQGGMQAGMGMLGGAGQMQQGLGRGNFPGLSMTAAAM